MNNQIPKFRELVMETSFFSVQNMCIYSMLYRMYRFIHKLIKFPAHFCFLQSQFCFLHGIRALCFLGIFLCGLHYCTRFLWEFFWAAFIAVPDFFSILQAFSVPVFRFFFQPSLPNRHLFPTLIVGAILSLHC